MIQSNLEVHLEFPRAIARIHVICIEESSTGLACQGYRQKAASHIFHLWAQLKWAGHPTFVCSCKALQPQNTSCLLPPAQATGQEWGTCCCFSAALVCPCFLPFPRRQKRNRTAKKLFCRKKTYVVQSITHLSLQELSRLCWLLSWKYYIFRYIKISIYQIKAQKKTGYIYLFLQEFTCFCTYTFLGCQWIYNIEKYFRKSFTLLTEYNNESDLSSFQISQTLHRLKPVKSVVTMTRTGTVFLKKKVPMVYAAVSEINYKYLLK